MKSLTMRMVAIAAIVLFAAVVVAQSTQEYLDIYQVQVKPEKRADFDAIAKKIAQANRMNSGDQWEAMESLYGEGNVITFVSHRKSYGEVESAMKTFNEAMSKAYGANADKMYADFATCLAWSHTEFRVRRWDLSNASMDPAERAKILGQSRFLRTTAIRVKPGRTAEFEAVLKQLKDARDKSGEKLTVVVSQSVAGTQGTIYYVTALVPSFSAFDNAPTMKQLLGDEEYAKVQKTNAEVIQDVTSVINRYVPEFSNVSTEVAAIAPEFWNPKPTMAAKKPMGKKTTTTAAKD